MRISVVLILALLQPGYAVAIRHVTHKTLRAAGQPRSLDVDLNDLPPGFSLVSVPSPVSEAIPPPFQGLLRPSDDSNLPSTYQRPAFAQGGRHQKRDLTQIAQTVFDAAGLEPASTNAHLANLVRGLQTSRLIFDVISSFNPIALLSLTTATGINITAGMTVFESDLQQEPQVFLAPTSPSVSPVALLFFLLDADSPTPSNAANGQTVQMLAQDLTIDPTAANSQGFPLMSLAAESLAEYVPPVFADQSGPHRMIALIYQQPLVSSYRTAGCNGRKLVHYHIRGFNPNVCASDDYIRDIQFGATSDRSDKFAAVRNNALCNPIHHTIRDQLCTVSCYNICDFDRLIQSAELHC
ncbi:uncharacterized protein L969DRAFT_93448 [Mixia osmundae IAM 14324]|uniref:PEBP-like protein n=1 Tax=Mixia osmundae (strain CBS 9802 / IAM 14324 / JCM 22182 / KY 12970) TaxID=764103 RepID=G7DSB6_MIXOS|nr:uncharacterized protein L969DRAFT_93448 [Mixia osmundae IAM 14324]KEI40928.1 hypothetical protein L969DRAFT_93448 [Mixia osmundae IAM 14324]GAA93476.1 hypothetical protein E5Q_00117 [Mixia osmundae IAM 14324]